MPRGAPGRSGEAVRVVVVDDHRSFAEALRVALDLERGVEVAAVCHDGAEALAAVRRKRPHVVLMDLRMPGVDGIAATKAVLEARPEARVVVLSGHDEEADVAQAVEAGAAGFLSKTVPMKDVARMVRAAARGEQLMAPEEVRRMRVVARRRRDQTSALRERVGRLSRRETEILQRMAQGVPPAEIARQLDISANTLRTHVQNILFKLRVHSKTEALAAAIRFGKVRVEPES
jgi:DNA-binding NarL/FixJ family response regulator